ncbi:IST1-like protein [Arachis hypogaea]|uniref:IST1-like protein n=1 Tax=Arachis hypogaea TaxID=3818 RepID=A0A6B9V303_ARAHY|nr:IST1-like protein [Arachis hypogaea]
MPSATTTSDSGGQKMFRWFLKPRFYSKCLTYVKFIRTRLESVQKKRNAVHRIMKSDIAELLRNGHYYDAYKRVEGLVLEQNMLFCYELVAQFIGCISDHVQDLTKQSICPDECKEAVPSLIYAAARISDLPELRDLRTMFTDKFGNSLEPYTSKELIEKLKKDPPSREMKIQLLHEIAQEFSIEWDSKALEQRLSRQPSLYEERPKPEKTEKQVGVEKEHKKETDYNASSQEGIKEFNDEQWRQQISSDDDDDSSTDMSSVHGRKPSSSSLGSISEDDTEIISNKKPYWLVPPPYLKQRTNKGEINSNSKKKTRTDSEPNHEDQAPRSSSRSRNMMKSRATEDNIIDSESSKNRRSYVRGTSLPPRPTNSSSVEETSRGHGRSISMDSEVKSIVHPVGNKTQFPLEKTPLTEK